MQPRLRTALPRIASTKCHAQWPRLPKIYLSRKKQLTNGEVQSLPREGKMLRKKLKMMP